MVLIVTAPLMVMVVEVAAMMAVVVMRSYD